MCAAGLGSLSGTTSLKNSPNTPQPEWEHNGTVRLVWHRGPDLIATTAAVISAVMLVVYVWVML